MAEENNDFVNFMLKKAQKKDEEAKPQEMLSPERDPEPTSQVGMSEEDMKSVEEFTANLKKKLQE